MTHHFSQNGLLAALPSAVIERISASLELVYLPLGEMIYEPNVKLHHAYFPTSAVISLHYLIQCGVSAEFAGIGNEGLVGTSLFMSGENMSGSAVVQMAGYAYKLKKQLLVQEFNQVGIFQQILLRYTQALLLQVSQTAVCNRHHLLEQQLCRWLLITIDRQSNRHSQDNLGVNLQTDNEITITQEFVANMLGVRREGVTEAAGRLQRAGLITYRRGHIAVIDRKGLENRTCECYSTLKKALSHLQAVQ